MPLPPSRVLRTFRYAMYFDGVDDYIRVPLSSSLQVSSVTLEIMLYRLGRPNNYNTVFGMGAVTGWGLPGGAYAMFNGAGGDGVIFQVYNTSNRYKSIGFHAYLGQWVHGACTYDASTGNAYCYQNGSLYQSASGWAPIDPSSYRDVYISYRLPFMIAYARVYSRALSGSEIQWNYLHPDNPVRNGLVLWLQAHPSYVKDIDGDGILEWIDLSGYNNHGKIYGAQLVELIKTPPRLLSPVGTLQVVR